MIEFAILIFVLVVYTVIFTATITDKKEFSIGFLMGVLTTLIIIWYCHFVVGFFPQRPMSDRQLKKEQKIIEQLTWEKK